MDYYQREYRWEAKHVSELLDDLIGAFLKNYEAGQTLQAVARYSLYFLGTIIISNTQEQRSIVDGQQRLTTLTLLLIYLYRNLHESEGKSEIANLIFSMHLGERSFNLSVPEREACMRALFNEEQFNAQGQPESIANIIERFEQIAQELPQALSAEDEAVTEEGQVSRVRSALVPFFANWLIEKVYLVEITTFSEADAYTIFETMNDRGLSLTPTEMLKGYLLTSITDIDRRNEANNIWKQRVVALQELGKAEDGDAIKAWLRSQHADDLRDRSRNSAPRDFERIGTEFHRWVGGKEGKLGLNGSPDFFQFIKKDFDFYSRRYEEVRKAAEQLTAGLEAIHYNAHNNFTLQYTVLLAPLQQTDTDAVIRTKLSLVAKFIDILVAQRIWNWRNFGYSTMNYSMFSLVRDIRHNSIEDLAKVLVERLRDEGSFTNNPNFRLHGTNGRKVHYLLARITDYVQTGSQEPSQFHNYMNRRLPDPYEIEHIWAEHFHRHQDEYQHLGEEAFKSDRNLIGGLLLLPKSVNASLNDKIYEDKLDVYYGQNLMAKSLHKTAYQNLPRFSQFREQSGLPFKSHAEFKKADLSSRQELYRLIAEQIWNPDNLLREAGL